MENATKALMIAGAVLIAIMIIGVGMMIFNQGNDAMTRALNGLSEYDLQQFNSQLEGYQGVQKGTNVKSLIGRMITLNTTNKDAYPEKLLDYEHGNTKITSRGDNADIDKNNNELSSERAVIVAGKSYEVKFETTSGLITKVIIVDK